ncbi:MAG: preprotein translocase subunit YajC [Clostridiales bacterium]|nr:preprotein translocase subunit YajC [Clostridiales bacterium]MDY5348668.1 preprotein translocase subunit YajC [Candidatus Ventricola sp.]MDY5513458.1 preprotein translocase subunit YajC [Candidatus Ventricola sp.]
MKYTLMNLLADAAATAGTEAAAAGEAAMEEMSAGATFVYYAIQFLPMILIFVVFWFFLIRPQRKKDKEAQQMLKNLKVGDRICTIGGIYGTITRIKDDVLTVEVGDAKTQMVLARWAVKNIDTLSISNDAETLI